MKNEKTLKTRRVRTPRQTLTRGKALSLAAFYVEEGRGASKIETRYHIENCKRLFSIAERMGTTAENAAAYALGRSMAINPRRPRRRKPEGLKKWDNRRPSLWLSRGRLALGLRAGLMMKAKKAAERRGLSLDNFIMQAIEAAELIQSRREAEKRRYRIRKRTGADKGESVCLDIWLSELAEAMKGKPTINGKAEEELRSLILATLERARKRKAKKG